MEAKDFGTRTLFNGKHITNYAQKNFDVLPASAKTDGSLKAGDILMMTMPGGSQHVAVFKEYDEKGRIHFFGSQTSTGPAESSDDRKFLLGSKNYFSRCITA